MAEIMREKVVVVESGETNQAVSSIGFAQASIWQTMRYITYFLFGAIDVLLIFRLILKVLGANPTSGFVMFIYNLTNIFVAPFEGIFRNSVAQGAEVKAVLEPAAIVAIIVYTILALGIAALVQLLSRRQQSE